MLVVYDWIKEYLGEKTPSPEKMEELFTFHAFEVEGIEAVAGQQVIDVDVLPNRSSDCLSHRGIARELATILDVEMEKDVLREKLELPKTEGVKITIDDGTACRKFGTAVMTNITVKDSPDWLKKRLEAIGQRPINNVVDATNYVMFALGQPLHAYDAEKLGESGAYHLGVRMAKDGEKVTVLTGEEYELTADIQIITEGNTDMPIGIAGIKGGMHAEIDEKTTSIVLEAANFDPTITRKASQKLRLQTDASKRFENEPSRELVEYALTMTADLLEEIGGGACEGYSVSYPTPYNNPEVSVSAARIEALLGVSIEKTVIASILKRLGFNTAETEDGFAIVAPFERTDIQIEEDVIEEIGRIYGYEHIESVVPESVSLTEINKRHYYSEKVRKILLEEGFSEVITSSFRKKDEIKLRNALASDKAHLRSSLRKNIAEVLELNIHNKDLLGLSDIRVFEIGTVFSKGEGVVGEQMSLTLGVRQKPQGATPKDDDMVKQALKKLEAELSVETEYVLEKGVAEINLSELLTKLSEPEAYEPHEVSEEIQYQPFSTYPFIARDIALWVEEGTTATDVETVLNKSAGELRVRTTLFDEFHKDGKVSYAFRLVFQSNEKTLTDSEVNECMEKVVAATAERNWMVR